MADAGRHEDEGIFWSLDASGVLAIDLAPGGDGTIPMNNITEMHTTPSDWHADEGYEVERRRTVAYVTPWEKLSERIAEVRIGEGITSVPRRAFHGLNGLKRVTLPAGLRELGDEAFEFCEQLEGIDLPGSLSSMGCRAFHGCKSLRSVTFGEGIWCVSVRAFWDCRSLESVRLPSTLHKVGEGAFCGCKSLANVAFPDGLSEIGPSAFSGCDALGYVDIPDSVEKVGDHAFLGCKEATVPNHIQNLDEVFGYARDGRRIKRRRKSLFSGLFGRKR